MTDQLSVKMVTDSTNRIAISKRFLNDFQKALNQSGVKYDVKAVKLETKFTKTSDYELIFVELCSLLGTKATRTRPIFRVFGKKKISISFTPALKRVFEEHSIPFTASKSDSSNMWPRLNDDAFLCFRSSPRLAVDIFETVMKQAEFGCCSRYEACSDAGHCVHPDIMFAMQCAYRQNLINGKIFYGKNKNI